MELTWYGLGCFRLAERGFPSVVMDPFDPDETGLDLGHLQAELVTISRLADDPRALVWPQVRGVSRTIASPGEYEIGGVFVTGVACSPVANEDGLVEEYVVYTVGYGGVVVCHLGELNRAPTQAQVEAIGPVTVLLIPVGIPDGLTPAMASETVSLIEPEIVIPMQYHLPGLKVDRNPLDGFLKELGVSESAPLPSLKVTDGVESEETQVIVLAPQ